MAALSRALPSDQSEENINEIIYLSQVEIKTSRAQANAASLRR